MKKQILFQIVLTGLFLMSVQFSAFAQNDPTNDDWINSSSTTISTNRNVFIGAGTNTGYPLFIDKGITNNWSTRIRNGNTNVYFSHQKGYGMHINTGTTSDNYYGLLIRSANKSSIFRVNNNGNVGINVTNPSHKLHVYTGSASFKTYQYGTEITVNTTGGWARSNRFRNENDDKTIAFGAVSGRAYISTGFDIAADPTGYQNQKLTILENGNTGIGTISPVEKLDVEGAVQAVNHVRVKPEPGHAHHGGILNLKGAGSYSGWDVGAYYDNISFVSHAAGGRRVMWLNKNGKLVIGEWGTVDWSPNDYKLIVKDGILTEKVKIAVENSSDWADYVFEEDYDLKSLEEVAEFVKENKHLPNVPSADEVVEGGIDVAKMDAKLLEKIEELTLYIIELDEKIKRLEAENNTSKK